MRKIAYALVALFLGLSSLQAQNKLEKINLTYGEELPDDGVKIVKIIGENNNKIYALAVKKDDFSLKIFDAGTMKQLSSKKIVIPEMNDKDVEFEDVFMLNGKLYAIGSVYNSKTKIYNLVGSSLSEDGVLSKKGVVLFDAEVAKKSQKGAFYFKEAPAEDKLLIMHACEFPKEDAVKYEVKLFDENLQSYFAATDKVHFDDKKKDFQFLIADFDLNVNGDVFLAINESYRDSKKKEKVERFEVHAFKKANSYAKEIINIDFKNKEIINCKMMATSNNMLQMVGFYSGVRESGRAEKELKGIYNINIDLAGNTVNKNKFNEFDYATKVKLLGERRAKKGKDVKPLYTITNIIEKNDGGLIVLSEFRMVIIGNSQSIGPIGFTQVNYIKNEIIVTCLNPDGSFSWGNVVPKAQSAATTTMSFVFGGVFGVAGNFAVGIAGAIPLTEMGKGPEYLGAIPIYKNGELSIMINDNVKNKGITDIEEIKSMGNYNNAVPSLFIFDAATGKMTRKDPEEAIKNELVLRPGVYYRKSPKEYLVYSSRKKKDKLGRMLIED